MDGETDSYNSRAPIKPVQKDIAEKIRRRCPTVLTRFQRSTLTRRLPVTLPPLSTSAMVGVGVGVAVGEAEGDAVGDAVVSIVVGATVGANDRPCVDGGGV